jgi:hypothetical protein
MPVAEEAEHRMALELARLRALEAAAVIATLATSPPNRQRSPRRDSL